MPVLSADGMIWVEVDDSHERSLLGNYWNDVHRFRDTGDLQALGQYEGETVGGQPLLTDPDDIEFWAYQGELDFPDIYRPYA